MNGGFHRSHKRAGVHPIIQSADELRVEAKVSMEDLSDTFGRSPSWWSNMVANTEGKYSLNVLLHVLDDVLGRFGHEIVIRKTHTGTITDYLEP